MSFPPLNGKADRNASELRAAKGGAADCDSIAGEWYTIEYAAEDAAGARRVALPMLFHDKDTAVLNARALLRAGFFVLRVTGPDFEIGGTMLADYLWSRHYK